MKNYVQAIRNHLDSTGTDSTTVRCIRFYLNAWLCHITPPAIYEIAPDKSDTLIKAIKPQNKIGWDQWIYGRISIHWGELYNYDQKRTKELIHEPKKRRSTTTSWGRSIDIITWNFLIELWCCRNNIEHQSDKDSVKRKKKNW
jgi:hypothetical protein